MATADSELIKWLLTASGVSRYHISNKVEISQSTLSRIAHGETPMSSVSFGVAAKLTRYARHLQAHGDDTGYTVPDEALMLIEAGMESEAEYTANTERDGE